VARPKRRFTRLLLLLSLIGVAAAIAAPFVPLAPLKDEVELNLSEALGRKVTIDSARLNLISGPSITVSGMTAQESPGFGDGKFLVADQVRADIDIIQYLRTRRFVIDSITFISPHINIIKNSDGVWSWTTLGKQPEQATLSRVAPNRLMGFPALSILFEGGASGPAFNKIRIENASVKLIDRAGSGPAESLYKNIGLTAELTRANPADSERASRLKGELVAQSEEDGEAELLKTALPFDLQIDRGAPALSISGSIGPGPVESRNVDVGDFGITGKIRSEKGAGLTGDGKMSANHLFIRTINLSEQVARALKVDQIGDTSPGTAIDSLETDFQISQGSINTPGLRIQQIDGLGDATTQNGSFKIESALTVNYAATIVLSADATSRLKQINSMMGVLVTIFESNQRVSVPISIRGDVRKPEIQVDVTRMF